MKLILSLIMLATAVQAQLPAGTVCLQAVSEIKCSARGSDCFYGHRAYAQCNQSAVFKNSAGEFISVAKTGEGFSYECGLYNFDKSLAIDNAKANLHQSTGSFELIPKCQ